MQAFTETLTREFKNFHETGHALEIGHAFIEGRLTQLQDLFNAERSSEGALPHLAALVCFSPLDIALHDAYGNLQGKPIYETYTSEYLTKDLSAFLEPAEQFKGKFPSDFLESAPTELPVWHLWAARSHF